jgi:hypothetical protein
MNTNGTCFITTGGNDTPTVGQAADDKGFISVLWEITLFDGSKKSIHVYVNYFS